MIIQPPSVPPAKLRLSSNGQPPRGRLTPPGDAVLAQLALLLALLAVGRSRISGVVESEAVLAVAEAVRAFGGEVDRVEPGVFAVQGVGLGGLLQPLGAVSLAEGEGASFLPALASTHRLRAVFGPGALISDHLVQLLSQFGARFARDGGQLAVSGPPTALPVSFANSAISETHRVALMLAALNAAGISSVAAPSGRLRGAMHLFTAFGALIRQGSTQGVVCVQGLPELRPADIVVPPDSWLCAIALAVAAVSPGADLVVADQLIDSGRERFLSGLTAMGAILERGLPRQGMAGIIADVRVRQAGRATYPAAIPDCPEPENAVLKAAAELIANSAPPEAGLAHMVMQTLKSAESAATPGEGAFLRDMAEMSGYLATLGLAISRSTP